MLRKEYTYYLHGVHIELGRDVTSSINKYEIVKF